MQKTRKTFQVTALVFALSAITSNAHSWEAVDYTSEKQMILQTYFVNSKGSIPSKRPSGPHKQMSIVCTSGYLEIGFFDINSSGTLLSMGNPGSVSARFNGNSNTTSFTVSTDSSGEYLRITNPGGAIGRIKTSKSLGIEFSKGGKSYKATFDIRDVKKYVSKFAAAGWSI